MRKTKILSFLAVCAMMVLAVVSCKDDEFEGVATKISVIYPSETFVVDLNAAKYPPIVCVINSERPLSSVKTYIVRAGATEEIGREATEFFNPHSYSVNVIPVYADDMETFRVVAKDNSGTEVVSEMPLDIIPMRGAPTVRFAGPTVQVNGDVFSITYKEGDPMPEITVSAQSEDDLNSVTLSEVVDNLETVVPMGGEETVNFDAGIHEYSYPLSTDNFVFKFKTTALRFTATAGAAGRPKTKVGVLKVNYIEAPAPVTVFEGGLEPVDVKEFNDLTFKGSITSESPLNTVKYLLQITGKEDSLLSSVTEFTYPYEFTQTVTRIGAGVTGFVVEATNELGKVSRTVKPIVVEELAPAPVIVLNQAEGAFLAVDKDANLKLTGHVEAPGGLKKFMLYKRMMDGSEVEENLLSAEDVTLENVNHTFKAEETLVGLRLEAVDANNKSHEVSYDVTVGYHYYYLEASVSGGSTATRETQPGFLFSAQKARVYDNFCDAKADADLINVAFTSASSYKTINVDKIHYYDKLSMPSTNAGCASVIKKDGVVVPQWGKEHLLRTANIKRSQFDQATISQIQAEPLPAEGTGNNVVRVTLAQGGYDHPTENVCLYAIEVNGVQKRVLICFDKISDPSWIGVDKARFWIKVKVEK